MGHDRLPARRRPTVLIALLTLVLGLGWLGAVVPQAAADGPTPFTNATSIAIPGTGPAPDQIGSASPYPSNVTVAGMAGAVTKVTVTFTNLTHGSAPDIDALLVAPTGANLVLMADVGPPDSLVTANGVTLTFDDSAATPVPGGSIPTGTYRPTNNAGADTFPAPAPAPSSLTTLSGAFTGINPNGTWSLYVVDDATGDFGSMAGGWTLTVTTEVAAAATTTTVTSSDTTTTTGQDVTFTATVQAGGTAVTTGSVQFTDGGANLGSAQPLNASGQATFTTGDLAEGTHEIRAVYSGASGFLTSTSGPLGQRVDNATVVTGDTYCNPGPITPPAQGAASPYPSNVVVTGQAGEITKVTATLNGLSHTAPIDLDVLLSGPTPTTNVVLLSDTGGQPAVSNVTVTFDDDAPGAVPTPLTSGTFRPTDDDAAAADAPFPAPAPVVSSATQLATFDGTAPNGTWSLWVVDDASGDLGSIAGGWCLTVTAQQETETALASSANPSRFGDEVTFTATVTADDDPVTEGSVQFSDGGTVLDTVPVNASGIATYPTSALAVGSHPIEATYVGTDDFAESSADLTQVVDRALTDTALAAVPNPSDVGESVTFTATVTDTDGDPVTSGTVQFRDAGTALGGPVPVNGAGVASLPVADLAAGTHPITATFSGTAELDGSTSPVVQQLVERIATETVLESSDEQSEVGEAVTFTATVTDAAGDPVTTGTVQFSDDGAALGIPQLVNGAGVATLVVADLPAGTHLISATFVQTAQYAESTSSTLEQVVGLVPTTTTLSADPNPSDVGEDVTFTATVTVTAGGGPVTSGTVEFADDGTPIGTGTVGPGGEATFTTSTLPAGTHPITATFLETAQFAESASFPALDHVVEKIVTTITLLSSANPSDPGDAVTFTATVTDADGDPVTVDEVTFTVDGVPIAGGPVPLDGAGIASFDAGALDPGGHTVVASYAENGTYRGSAATVIQLVRPIAEANGFYVVVEGDSLTLAAAGSTDGADYAWDVNGDGDYSDATGLAPTLTWDELEALGIDDGPSTVTVGLRVTLDGASAEATAELTVTNTGPASVLTGGLTATVGVPYTIKVGADDPSSADMAALFTYTVDWGDGSPTVSVPGPADPPVTHTYTTAGAYDATFTATDKDGSTGAETTVVVLVDPAQTASPTPNPSPTTDDPDDSDDSDDGDGDLAATGSPVGPGLILAGIALLASGLGLLTLSARRRYRSGRHRG